MSNSVVARAVLCTPYVTPHKMLGVPAAPLSHVALSGADGQGTDAGTDRRTYVLRSLGGGSAVGLTVVLASSAADST